MRVREYQPGKFILRLLWSGSLLTSLRSQIFIFDDTPAHTCPGTSHPCRSIPADSVATRWIGDVSLSQLSRISHEDYWNVGSVLHLTLTLPLTP